MKSIQAKLIGLGCMFLWIGCPLAASAQARSPRAEVKLTYGLYGYDEDAVKAIGGAFAYYPTPRTSGEMELLYLFENNLNCRGFALTPSYGVDFRHNPVTFQPYGRLAETIDWLKFGKGQAASSHGNFTIRFGFRVYVTDRIFLSPEFGLGERLNMKFSISAGYVTAFQTVPD